MAAMAAVAMAVATAVGWVEVTAGVERVAVAKAAAWVVEARVAAEMAAATVVVTAVVTVAVAMAVATGQTIS